MTEAADSLRVPDPVGTAFPLRFLANGRLVSLQVGGHEVLREAADRSGFFVAWFDGTRVREIPLPHVSVNTAAELRVVAGTTFPRLVFAVSVAEGGLALALKRAEGMPPERDVSIGFRAGLSTRCDVTAHGADVIIRMLDAEVQVFWTGTGARMRTVDYGGFVLKRSA